VGTIATLNSNSIVSTGHTGSFISRTNIALSNAGSFVPEALKCIVKVFWLAVS
jgi:hypothetical protein